MTIHVMKQTWGNGKQINISISSSLNLIPAKRIPHDTCETVLCEHS